VRAHRTQKEGQDHPARSPSGPIFIWAFSARSGGLRMKVLEEEHMSEGKHLMTKGLRGLVAALLLFAAGHSLTFTRGEAIGDLNLQPLRHRLIGPFVGGRVSSVAGVSGDSNTYYFGAVAGGVWKTGDGGTSWRPIADGQPFWSVGALAVSESDPRVIYVGTGDTCIRVNVSHGDGVYKSVDSGQTWLNVGLKDTRHIGRVVIHPRLPDIAFVAALGHLYGTNEERGVFRTADGGCTWKKVLYVSITAWLSPQKVGLLSLSKIRPRKSFGSFPTSP